MLVIGFLVAGLLVALPFIFFGPGDDWFIKWMWGTGGVFVVSALIGMFGKKDKGQVKNPQNIKYKN